MAALEQDLRRADRAVRLRAMVDEVTPARLARLPPGTGNWSIRCAESGVSVRERQLRFRALLLRRAYPLADYLPPEAVLNLRRVDHDPFNRFVLLTLWSGTQLLDTGDCITVRGAVDDVAVSELVACVQRRGWGSVVLTGDDGFRMAASRELLRRGIEVVDCPLDEEEQEMLRQEATELGFGSSTMDGAITHMPNLSWAP